MHMRNAITIALAVAMILSPVSMARADLNDANLLGYWNFDETSGAVVNDTTANANNGAITGDPAWVPAGGALGGALDFDNNGDYVTVPGAGIPLANSDFSLSFWVNRDGLGDDYVIGHSNGGGSNSLHIGFRDADTFTMAFWGDDMNVDNAMFNNTSDWMHFVCTYDAATNQQIVYANVVGGGSVTQNRTANNDFLGSADFFIGSRGSGNNQFDGLVDEVGVWNRTLTPAEAVELYNGGTPLYFFSVASETLTWDGDVSDWADTTVHGGASHWDSGTIPFAAVVSGTEAIIASGHATVATAGQAAVAVNVTGGNLSVVGGDLTVQEKIDSVTEVTVGSGGTLTAQSGEISGITIGTAATTSNGTIAASDADTTLVGGALTILDNSTLIKAGDGTLQFTSIGAISATNAAIRLEAGTLSFQNAGAISVTNPTILVASDATIEADTTSTATFGALTINDGITLTVAGADGGTDFANLAAITPSESAAIAPNAGTTVTVGNALSLGDGATFISSGAGTTAFTGAPTLSGTTATIGSHGTLDLGGPLAITAAQTLNITGLATGAVKTSELQAPGATVAINFADGAALATPMFNDGAVAKQINLTGNGVLFLDSSASDTITAGASTFKVGPGATLRAYSDVVAAPSGPLGVGGSTVNLDGGTAQFRNAAVVRTPVTYDFESGDLTGWTIVPYSGGGTGDQFVGGKQPYSGEAGAQGTYTISTYRNEVGLGGDNLTGIIETDSFVIGEAGTISFQQAAGSHALSGDPDSPNANMVGIALERQVGVGDWEMVETATNTGNNWVWKFPSWDTTPYIGDTVRLRIYDTHPGGWGHTAVDDIQISSADVVTYGALAMGSIDFIVTQTSTLRAQTILAATFGDLTLTNGTLNITEAVGGTTFASLTPVAAAANVGIDSQSAVNFGNALTLGDGASITLNGEAYNFTGAPTLSGTSATIAADGAVDLDGALSIAGKTLNVNGGGSVSAMDLLASGATTINLSGGSTLNATGFNDGATPGSTVDLSGDGVLAINGSAGGTIAAADTTFNVGAGSTLRAAHAAAGPMGAGGTNLLLTGGTFRVDGESTGTYTFDQVEYAWYNDVNHDNMRKIDDGTDGNGTNGGLFSLVPTPEGSWPVQVQGKASWTTEVTHASISDTYVEMWSGNFHAPTTGDYTFYVHGDDNEILWMDLDLSGDFNWVDLNTNGILDSGEGDVVTSNDIPEGWNIPRTFTVSLEGGEVYPFAVAHSEGGGGDDFWFSLNGTPVNPGSAAQAGLWSTGPTVLEPINMLTTDIEVTADSTLRTATSTTADFGALTLTDGTLNIQTRSAGNVTSFTSLTPIAALATVGISSDATVNVGGALTLGNESSFTFTGDTINFTGDAVLSGGSATIGVNSTLNVGGALPIAAKTLNVAGDGTINTTELQTGGASAINFSGGATVNALAFTDGGAPGSILDVTGNGTLAIDGSAGGTITADNSTIVIGHDATVTAAYAPSGNLGPAGTTLQMDGGVFSTTGQVVDLASAQLIHYGYHINNDALALDLNNNGGLMGGGDPTNGPNYFGQAVLTAGPGGRGLDFDIDADFTATGAIGQNDDYSNMWLGYLEADETGNWGLRNGGDDDVGAIWIDLDRDGVFESSIPGLGTNRGEQISYEDGGNKLVALTAGERYMVAFLHREGGGGSRADFRFTAPSVGERIIKPSDPAQAGLWWDDAKSLAAIDMSTTNVEVNDDSNLIASTGATATFGELKLASGILDVSGADGGVIFNSINPAMVPDGAVTGIVSNDPLTLTGVLNVGDGVDLSLSTAPSGGIVLNDDAADGIALTMRTEGLVNWTNYSYAADAVSLVHAGPDTLQLLELGATDALLTTFTAQGGILEFSGFTPLGGSTADLIMAGGEVKISGAAGGPISLTAGLVVTKDSILDAVTDTTADFGALSFDDSGAGAMLTTSGATGSINFTSTTILTATGDIGFDTASDTKAGQLDFNSTGATIVKTGDADLILDGGAALGLVGGEGIDVRAGRLIVQASSNPMGVDTAVGINGGEVVLVSSAAGTPETFDNSVTSTGGTLTAGADGGANIGALTVTVGNATGNDVTLTSGDLLLQTTDDYTLNITGNVAGEGNMTIGAASTIVVQGTIGSALTPVGAVTIDGSLETKNAVTVNELVANAGGVYTATGAVKDLTVAQTLTLNSGIDLSGANVVLDGANVTVSNGVLAVGNNLGVATPVASVDVSKGGGLSLGGNSLKTQKLATTGGTFDMGATGSFVATGDVAITPAGGPAQLQLSGGTLSIQGPGGAMPTNLQMHLDAADSATLFQDAAGTIAAADGTSVALWQDKSGNGNDVSQTNGVLLPVYETSANTLNGESTVHFTADHLVRPNDIGTDGNKDRTVVTVWHNASGVMNYNHVLHMGANAGGQAYGHSISRGGSDGVIGNHYWADGFNTTANTGYSQANIAISTWDGDGGTGANGLDSWYVNGEFVGAYDRAALNTSTANLFIGTRVQPQAEGVDGNYAEILVFDKVLSADEINDIGGFLSSKWGVGVPLWTGSLATAMNLVDTDILMTSATAINATTDVTLGNLVVDVPSPVVLTFTGAEELQINLTSTTFSNPLTGAPGLIVDTAPKVNLGPLDMANSNNPVSEKIGTGEWIITDALSNFTGIGSLNVNEGALTLGDTGLLGTTIVNVNAATLKLSSVDTNPDPTYNEAIILTDGTTVLAGMADANSAPAAVVTLPSVINMSGQSLTLGTTDVGYELNIANPVTAGSLNLGGVGTVTFNAGGTVENATVDSSATGTINVPTTLTVTKKLTLKDVPITDNVPMQVVGSNLANPTGTITVSGSAFQIGLPESSIASDGLLGMWTFDGSNGNDTSGNGYNGTAHGPVAYVARNGGMALDLTGGDAAIFVDTGGTQDVFSGYDAMTIGVWAKGSPGNWSPFVSKDENGWQMRRNGGNNNLDWTTRGLTSSDWQVPNSGPAFNGDWHFIVMTYDGAEKKTFIYGDDLAAPIVESIGATGTITNTEDMLVFGARDNDNAAATIGWQTFLNGQLDDIYFYSRALSQAEIEGLYTPVFSTLAPIDMPELNLEMNPGVSSIAVNSTQATLGDLTMGDNTALTVNGTPSISLNDVTVNPAAASINSGGPEIATTVRGTLATAGGTDLTTSIAVNGSLTMGAGSALNAVGADVAAKDFTNNGGTVAFDGASSLTLTSSSLTQNGGSTAFEPTATASGITAIDVQAGSLTTPDTIATETLNVSTGAVLNAAMPVSVSTGATIGDDVVATITGPAFGVSGSDVLAARTLTLNGGSMALTGATIGGSTIPAGIRIWLDASDVNGDGSAAPADGTPIAAWGDKSGYANNATQGAVGDQPVYVASSGLNGQPAIRFTQDNEDNGDDFNLGDLSAQFPTGASVYFVVKPDEAAHKRYNVFGNSNNDSRFCAQGWSESQVGEFRPGGQRVNMNAAYAGMSATDSVLYVQESDASVYRLLQDGAVVGTGGPNYFSGSGLNWQIGNRVNGGQAYNGDIAEMIFFDRVLTPEEANNIGGYLATKYGLTTSYTGSIDTTPLTTLLPNTTIATTVNSEVAIAGAAIELGGIDTAAATTLTVNSPATAIELTNLTMADGSVVRSTATLTPGEQVVDITVSGKLTAGEGVASLGDYANDDAATNLTLSDGAAFDWTFGVGADNYLEIGGTTTIAGVLDVQLLDGGGTAAGEDVRLMLSHGLVDISAATLNVTKPAGTGWTWDSLTVEQISASDFVLVLKNLVTAVVSVPGDANGDGDVDDADLALFEAQFGFDTPGNSCDFDGDGDVDLDDFVIIRGNFGFTSAPEPAAPDFSSTPEPATMSLLAIGGLLVLRRRRRK